MHLSPIGRHYMYMGVLPASLSLQVWYKLGEKDNWIERGWGGWPLPLSASPCSWVAPPFFWEACDFGQ